MDYSAYYLKNIYGDESKRKRYTNRDYRTYRDERDGKYAESEPQVIYLQPPPELMQQSAYKAPTYDYEAVEVGKLPDYAIPNSAVKTGKKRKKMGRFRKVLIVSLLFIISVLSTIVASDIITQGSLMGTLSVWAERSMMQYTYFALVIGQYDDLAQAKIQATQLRLQGGAGYIVQSGAQYWVIADAYEQEQDAQDVARKYSNAAVIELSQPKINYKRYDAKYRGTLEGYMDYSYTACDQMYRIATQLADGQISTAKALDEIYLLKLQMQREIDQFRPFAEQVGSEDMTKILADMQIIVSVLDTMAQQTDYALLADLRYYRVQLLYNFAALSAKLAE